MRKISKGWVREIKDEKLYLIHIAEQIGQLQSYTQSGRDAFVQTRMIQDAVIRNFEVIGEATKRISEELYHFRKSLILYRSQERSQSWILGMVYQSTELLIVCCDMTNNENPTQLDNNSAYELPLL